MYFHMQFNVLRRTCKYVYVCAHRSECPRSTSVCVCASGADEKGDKGVWCVSVCGALRCVAPLCPVCSTRPVGTEHRSPHSAPLCFSSLTSSTTRRADIIRKRAYDHKRAARSHKHTHTSNQGTVRASATARKT